jgi:hypothetical protein
MANAPLPEQDGEVIGVICDFGKAEYFFEMRLTRWLQNSLTGKSPARRLRRPTSLALPYAATCGKSDHEPDLLIFFTFASVASIDAANSRIAFARRSAASFASRDRSARSA